MAVCQLLCVLGVDAFQPWFRERREAREEMKELFSATPLSEVLVASQRGSGDVRLATESSGVKSAMQMFNGFFRFKLSKALQASPGKPLAWWDTRWVRRTSHRCGQQKPAGLSDSGGSAISPPSPPVACWCLPTDCKALRPSRRWPIKPKCQNGSFQRGSSGSQSFPHHCIPPKPITAGPARPAPPWLTRVATHNSHESVGSAGQRPHMQFELVQTRAFHICWLRVMFRVSTAAGRSKPFPPQATSIKGLLLRL
jgi:hypothetical protein